MFDFKNKPRHWAQRYSMNVLALSILVTTTLGIQEIKNFQARSQVSSQVKTEISSMTLAEIKNQIGNALEIPYTQGLQLLQGVDPNTYSLKGTAFKLDGSGTKMRSTAVVSDQI